MRRTFFFTLGLIAVSLLGFSETNRQVDAAAPTAIAPNPVGTVFASSTATTNIGWSALSQGVSDIVWAVATSGSNVYVGGNFTVICGNSFCLSGNTTANHIAKWNGSSWSTLGNGLNGSVYALAISGTDVYAGGAFTEICGNSTCDSGNTTVNHIAKWNGSSWSALSLGLTDSVMALAVSGGNLYAGGHFTGICNPSFTCPLFSTSASHIAKWNGSAWSTVGYGLNAAVRAFATSGTDVYIGGDFAEVCGNAACNTGNTAVNHVVKWNGSNWSALSLGLTGDVYALALSGNDLYVGGSVNGICNPSLPCIGNTPVNYIAKWNGSAWSPIGALGGTGANGLDWNVNALVVSGNDVYAGGVFQNICGNSTCSLNNTPANRMARWNGNAWSALGDGVDYYVYGLAFSGTDLHIGGQFTHICGNSACDSGNVTANRVARYRLPTNLFLPFIAR